MNMKVMTVVQRVLLVVASLIVQRVFVVLGVFIACRQTPVMTGVALAEAGLKIVPLG